MHKHEKQRRTTRKDTNTPKKHDTHSEQKNEINKNGKRLHADGKNENEDFPIHLMNEITLHSTSQSILHIYLEYCCGIFHMKLMSMS